MYSLLDSIILVSCSKPSRGLIRTGFGFVNGIRPKTLMVPVSQYSDHEWRISVEYCIRHSPRPFYNTVFRAVHCSNNRQHRDAVLTVQDGFELLYCFFCLANEQHQDEKSADCTCCCCSTVTVHEQTQHLQLIAQLTVS